ncbi:LysM peptidoglycan-binding domain-containing protein [Lactococcus allomyrinae]|uniref:Peptidoglycan hydrolase n=1 Tax=Lactococcus allomyrinae TaxID=2419773 RepID=A0A387BFF3_9LACT|nr:LysM peptidoglycan-binding domain-containing protein [Lactococcus allomyrinae]AYF99639.1 LysM peptidoglycan-binding domain-containing protein [Lactococcus allomyrinae]
MKRKYKLALGASIVALASLGGVKVHASSVQEIVNAAVPVANEYGLYPSVMIAQGILESNGGQSALASSYNNIFGVKYTSGTPVYLPTQEYLNGQMTNVVEPFQAYASIYEACLAQAELLRSSSYYSGAWRENTSSYVDATAWLQGRYATDPNYAAKLNNLISELGLSVYDQGGEISASQTSTTSSSAGNYKVQEGDTLSMIAAQYGTTVDALVSANDLENANDIHIGEVLQIAASSSAGGSSTTSSQAGNYTVQSGDSLYSIAEQYGTTVSAIMSANNIYDIATTLQVGQSLQIPVGSSTSTVSSVSSNTYTIQNGDSLYSIATANGMTADQLAAINGFGLDQMIHPGQTIQI